MQSNGGVCAVETACRFPIRLVESGPAAGGVAAAHYGRLAGRPDLLSFDMGGTTAKACLIEKGEPLIAPDFEVARVYPFQRGSGVALNGPAGYGGGGTEPTVTDADLALGYLDPEFFLGGRMRLNREAALRAIADRVAKPLDMDPVRAAWGIHQVVNENMASAARIHAVERGKDVRRFPLFAFGGAGPVHACRVAGILRCAAVVCPLGAGVTSAVGFLAAPLVFDFVRTLHEKLEAMDWTPVNAALREMEEDGRGILSQTVPADQVTFRRW